MKTRKIFIGALLAISSFFVSTAFLPSTSLSQEVTEKTDVKVKTIKDVDDVLSTVATYEYGMSRESLTQLTDFERSVYGEPKTLKNLEKKYVKFLKSDASLAGKQFVCRRLSVFGTDESVSVLASLLLDPKTSNMARYALERVQSEKVISAMHKVLPKANGDVKIGIINTLGEKGDQKSVPVIAPFIYDNELSIASATAAALGKIADQQAIDALAVAKDKTSGDIRDAVLDAYLKCADSLLEKNQNADASAIYKQLDSWDIPVPVRTAAFSGFVYANLPQAGQILHSGLRNGDADIKTMAIMLIRNIPDLKNLSTLADELPHLAPIHKIQLLATLADVGDASVLETVVNATKDNDMAVRVAALTALSELGNVSHVELLAKAAATGQPDESEAALASLNRLKGDDVDQAIIDLVSAADPKTKVVLVESLGERYAKQSISLLMETANDSERRVRSASMKSLGQVADPTYLPQLVQLLIEIENNSERDKAVTAVANLAKKIPEPQSKSEQIRSRLASVSEVKPTCSLLRVLGKLGDDESLPVLQKALKDDNGDIQIASIEALSEWPTAAPINDLLAVAKKSSDVQQVLALRGYIGLIKDDKDLSNEEKLDMYKTAMGLAENTGEKKSILSGVSDVRTPEALKFASTFLKTEDVKEEAEVAVERLSDRIRNNHPEVAKKALEQLIKVTENESRRENAQKTLNSIK